MKNDNIILGLAALVILELILFGTAGTGSEQAAIHGIPAVDELSAPIIMPTATPVETIQAEVPKPLYIPTLKPMDCYNKNDDIWHPCNPSEYITPDNEWVKYYASQLFVDIDGRVKYKKKVPALWKDNGEVVEWTNKLFVNNYVTDNIQFNYPPNSDYWINTDYYLTNGMVGDCEDFAIALTSILQSGEVSIWKDSKLIKQVVPAKVVIGWTTYWNEKEIADSWSEYHVYNTDFIGNSQTRVADSSFSITNYLKKEDVKNQFKPLVEFTDKYFRGVE